MTPPQIDDEYRKQIDSARQQLDNLISDNKHYAPLMLHLALHDAGIYGFQTGTKHYLIKGGPNGSIRTPKELNHPSNKGLKKAVDLCAKDEVKEKNKKITFADLYQLAGVAAVQKTGGPSIEFVPGREDSTEYPEEGLLRRPNDELDDTKNQPEEGQLQPHDELDESTLEKITKRMGLGEKHMVALFGGLHQWSLPVESEAEKEQPKASGDNKKPEFKFDNSYFVGLKKREPNNLLLKGERFRKWAETYAEDNDAFRKNYEEAHKKVSELGMNAVAEFGQGGGKQADKKSSAPPSASSWNRVRVVQGIGIAVVTTAIILGFFLSRRSK